MSPIMMDKLVERVTSEMLKVDKANGVIRGVKVIGLVSKNNRRYTEDSLKNALGLFEGAGVNIDHPARDAVDADRPVSSRFGELRHARFVSGEGIKADLHFIRSHPAAEQIAEIAERFPSKIGLSIHGGGRTSTENGVMVVESLDELLSVDLVTSPASTAGLFESTGETTLVTDETANGLGIKLLGWIDDSEMSEKQILSKVAELIRARRSSSNPMRESLPANAATMIESLCGRRPVSIVESGSRNESIPRTVKDMIRFLT